MIAIGIFIGILFVMAVGAAMALALSPWWWILVLAAGLLLLVAIYDVVQYRYAVLRNFPVIGHGRYMMETIRPMVQQYFVERNYDGKPFDRDVRDLIYERANGTHSVKSFGTELEVRAPGYEYLIHAAQPGPIPEASTGCASVDRSAASRTTPRCSSSPR